MVNENNTDESKLIFGDIEFEEFLYLIRNQGNSNVVGPVTTQYEDDLKRGSAKVDVFGFYACDELVGAISYGVEKVINDEDAVAARLDIVITLKKCRGHGVGALLVTKMFENLINKYGENLKNISTIAAHPAIAKCVNGLGFTSAPDNSSTNRFYISLQEKENFDLLKANVEREINKRMSSLKFKCINCESRKGVAPWCEKPSRDDLS